jgi:hypothetical protein
MSWFGRWTRNQLAPVLNDVEARMQAERQRTLDDVGVALDYQRRGMEATVRRTVVLAVGEAELAVRRILLRATLALCVVVVVSAGLLWHVLRAAGPSETQRVLVESASTADGK